MSPDIFDMMLDQLETWFVTQDGCAMLVNDCSLMDN